jgi:hypothetical protein
MFLQLILLQGRAELALSLIWHHNMKAYRELRYSSTHSQLEKKITAPAVLTMGIVFALPNGNEIR